MLKKKITYVDLEGEERTEEFYFNLSRSEALEMQVSEKGGLDKYVEKIVSTRSYKELIELFKEIILKSYGVKDADGKRFRKSKELSEEFSQTEAYTELFLELANDPEAAKAFFNGVVASVKK